MHALTLLLLSGRAGAELPLPVYPECGEQDREDACPSDLDEEWWMISYIPDNSRATVRPAEVELGSGNRIDRAWRVTTGRFDVLLAVLDSGVNWGSDDYQNKIFLNIGELPLPQDADGVQAADYDLDGNGLVNIQDYAADPRVDITAGRDWGDGHLDASDLIYTFSDGVDDDGNGFVDDVAGWDFFGDDNDAFHELTGDDYGTHGDGVFEDIAAEGGDEENGDIGTCPNCAMLPVRVGDTFVTDGSRTSLGILYATQMGAVGVNLSVGALTNPDVAWEAARYAREHGVNIAGAAGDENAYHHNFPAMMDGILYVHSIRADQNDENSNVYSYFNFFNCNNYGPRIVLSADSPACATGATAITTGVIGLVHSAARDAGLTLTADEAYQLLVMSATDIHLTEEETERASTYPSGEGWDPFYGYGRINAGGAVEMVAAGNIPPTMDISSPSWFQTIDPKVGTLEISGYVAADRSSGFDWTLEVGVGHDPRAWTEVKTGSGTARYDGVLAELDLAALAAQIAPVGQAEEDETITGRLARVFQPGVTLRLRVTDADGRVGQLQKTFFVVDDPDLVDGFPLQMGASGESSPILADLDDDGVWEIVIADSAGFVHAYDATGAELPGWPVQSDADPRFRNGLDQGGAVSTLHEGFIGNVAVGDLDGDGAPEVVVAGLLGNVYAWHADGTRADGWPVAFVGRTPDEFDGEHAWDNGFVSAAVLYDLDGDGTMEVVAAGMDQRLYAWDAAGAPWGPYPIDVCDPELCDVSGRRIIATPAVGDVDADGEVEIGIGTNEAVNDGNSSISYLFDAVSGTLEDGWPLVEGGLVNQAALLPIVGEGHPGSMAFADIDSDGDLEIASPVMLGQSPLYHHDTTVARDLSYFSGSFGNDSNTNQPSLAQMTNNPAFGDMTGDGVPEYVIGAAGAHYLIALALYNAYDYQNAIGAWDGATGESLEGFPRQIEDLQFLVAPAVADLTDDGRGEAIMGSAGYLLHAWDAAGDEPEGWPKFTGNWILGSPAVGDIDGDGWVEVVVSTREGHVFAWHTNGPADQAIGWAGIHHDPQNTGNASTALAAQAGPERPVAVVPDQGCCNKGSSSGLLWLAPIGLLWRRRRSG